MFKKHSLLQEERGRVIMQVFTFVPRVSIENYKEIIFTLRRTL